MAVSITRIPPEVGDSYTTSVDVARPGLGVRPGFAWWRGFGWWRSYA